jgi:hypothetical protein
MQNLLRWPLSSRGETNATANCTSPALWFHQKMCPRSPSPSSHVRSPVRYIVGWFLHLCHRLVTDLSRPAMLFDLIADLLSSLMSIFNSRFVPRGASPVSVQWIPHVTVLIFEQNPRHAHFSFRVQQQNTNHDFLLSLLTKCQYKC